MAVDLRHKLLFVKGLGAVAVGTYLPWLRTNPSLPPEAEIPPIHYTGLGPGIEGLDVALLGAVGLVVLVRAISSRTRIHVLTTLVLGLGVVGIPAYVLAQSSLVGFSATFVPALGWYLTVLAGMLFTAAGGLELPTTIHWPTTSGSSRE